MKKISSNNTIYEIKEIESQFKSTISISCDIEYNNYKNKLLKEMIKQINYIYNIFDEELNDNLIKLYILIKKNKLENNLSNLINIIYEFVEYIKNIKYITPIIFLELILLLIKTNISMSKIYELFINTKYKDLVDIKIINIKFDKLISELCNNNLLINNLYKLRKSKIENKEEIKNMIKELVYSLSDFYIYYKSNDIIELLNMKLKIINYDNNITNNISKFKKKFINEYDKKYIKFMDLYSDISSETLLKYKYINKNKNFNELIKDIESLNNIE